MAKYLEHFANNNNLTIVDVAGDGDCFYHAVAQQLFSTGDVFGFLSGPQIREQLISFLLLDDSKSYGDQYVELFGQPFSKCINDLRCGCWADHFQIKATADMLNLNINILTDAGNWHVIKPKMGDGRKITIGYMARNHYVALEKSYNIEFPSLSETMPSPPNKKRPNTKFEQQKFSKNISEREDTNKQMDPLPHKLLTSPSIFPVLPYSHDSTKQNYKKITNTSVALEKSYDIEFPSLSETMPSPPIKKRPNTSVEQQTFAYSYDSTKQNYKKITNTSEKQKQYSTSKKPAEKKKTMTETERKRAYRARQTAEKKEQQLEKRRKSWAVTQDSMTKEERERQREQQRSKRTAIQESMTEEEKELQREQQRSRYAATQASLTEEQRNQHLERQRTRQATTRASMTEEERAQQREKDYQRLAARPENRRTQAKNKIGTKTSEILLGTVHVHNLSDTGDSIGNMNQKCDYCGALKFKHETPTLCCGGGKVKLPPFPKPPEEIYNLWFEDTPYARLFRANSRSLNNAVCLSSLYIKEKKFKGFSPSVIFEGKMYNFMGPLLAEPGVTPAFAQVYILDPSQQSEIRFANMYLPKMNENDKKRMMNLMETVQQVIHQRNPFIHQFKQVLDIPANDMEHGKVIISAKDRPQGGHDRVYNAQNNQYELGIVTNENKYDLVVQLRGGGLKIVSDLNPKAMPLHFTLLFPDGTPGWDKDLKHRNSTKRVSTREFYAFHMNVRGTHSDFLFQAGRLFQEWILYAWITCENQRLNYIRFNQGDLRADSYKNIQEHINKRQQKLGQAPADSLYQNELENAVGCKHLPLSHTQGPRWYQSKFQNGMAIVRHHKKPTLFITMTCNPNWIEIKSALRPGQRAQDRPDLVARVFKLKKDQLMNDLVKGNVLGKVVAYLWVVEFQKRGLPHVHILLILANEDTPKTVEEIDQIVCAEIPPDPSEEGISQEMKVKRQPLWDIVLNNMIHGPCGTQNPTNVCMEKGICKKKFPKPFQKESSIDQKRSYPIYRRRSPQDGGRTAKKGNYTIDNSWVVPYNPYLSTRYNCHINVESCISSRATKYLYKYVTKGPDRAMVSTKVGGQGRQDNRDEIKDYEDMRYVGSCEAAWRLFGFTIAENYPSVQVLRLHLENEHQVIFVGGQEENGIQQGKETELTAFFRLNAQEKEAKGPDFDPSKMPKYVDVPLSYTYNRKEKEWRIRKTRGFSIGRVHLLNPLAGDVFYLRILLHHDHCRGKISFRELMSIDDKVCDSYQEVCRELGLLSDDQEWFRVLTHAASTKFCPQIRALYVIILMFCQPANPKKLFDDNWTTWTDDFKRMGKLSSQTFSENQLRTMVRLDLQERLLSYQKDLPDFNLDPITDEEKATVKIQNPLVLDEKDYDVTSLKTDVEETLKKFTPTQKIIFDTIMEAVSKNATLQLFIYARGGCGKTYLLNTVLKAVRSYEDGGCVALAMGTTGIAAELLNLGRTFHSRMKAPKNPTAESMLNISNQSNLGSLVQMARLLLIDEATMLHRFHLEALDRNLRDLMGKPDIPFGGKIIILAGDFRQCLPVIRKANRAQIVKACINKSNLWSHFQVHCLLENMRVKASGDPVLEQFDEWTLGLGNGTANNENERVIIPENMLIQIKCNTEDDKKVEEECMKELCRRVFPDLEMNLSDPTWLEGRAVLAPTNKEVDTINDLMETWMSGVSTKLSSADTLENYQHVMTFNTEILNKECPSGFPRHILNLKPGMLLMLLRNINPKDGLCNGTKLIYMRTINNKLLVCKLAGSEKEVLIPRIKFITDPGIYDFEWTRLQFPVRVAFSTTINKSQGQTLKQVGLWLRTPVFSHGQFYVACSRVGNPAALHIAIGQQSDEQLAQTDNVIFREVFEGLNRV